MIEKSKEKENVSQQQLVKLLSKEMEDATNRFLMKIAELERMLQYVDE